MKILLYDTDLIFNSEIGSIVGNLKSKKAELIIAEDEKSYEKAIEDHKSVSLVILSIRLFEEGLSEELRRIKSNYPDSKIFVVGGRDLTDDVLRDVVNGGADNFITKPSNSKEVKKMIKGALK